VAVQVADSVLDLERAAEAADRMRDPTILGKIVLTMP
jgi:hypothetical protein